MAGVSPPSAYASSAAWTCGASRSGAAYTATLPSPFMPAMMDQRIRRLEQEVQELKQRNDELIKTVKQLQDQMDKKKP